MDEFVKYYRTLNEYVTFYEMLYSKNEGGHYLNAVEIHKRLMVDKEDYTDEQFVGELESLAKELRLEYTVLLDRYFNHSLVNFVVYKNNNEQVRVLYARIIEHIKNASKIDIHLLADHVKGIEQAIPLFSACVK